MALFADPFQEAPVRMALAALEEDILVVGNFAANLDLLHPIGSAMVAALAVKDLLGLELDRRGHDEVGNLEVDILLVVVVFVAVAAVLVGVDILADHPEEGTEEGKLLVGDIRHVVVAVVAGILEEDLPEMVIAATAQLKNTGIELKGLLYLLQISTPPSFLPFQTNL